MRSHICDFIRLYTWSMSGASTKWASGVVEVRRVSGVDKRQVAVPGPSWSVAFSTADKGTRRRAWEASSLITRNSHIWIIVSSPKCYTWVESYGSPLSDGKNKNIFFHHVKRQILRDTSGHTSALILTVCLRATHTPTFP